MKFSPIVFALASLLSQSSFSQVDSLKNHYYDNLNNDFLGKSGSDFQLDDNFHTSIKPYTDEFTKNNKGTNRIDASAILNGETGLLKGAKGIMQKGGSAGLQIKGIYKNRFSFSYAFLSGNTSVLPYLGGYIKNWDVVPGMGSAYDSQWGYSYQHHFGYFSYSPDKNFNFQIGRGKNFIGDGHRSLFLSDFANSYPFFKITTTFGKFKYMNLYAAFKDNTGAGGIKNNFKSKYGTFHYLSWNATKRLNFSLFESVIWQGNDANRDRGFDVNYLNPVIFFRPVEYSLGSSDNSFLGAGFKIKVGKEKLQQFYGQVILDEFLLSEVKAMKGWWGNKQGMQIGFKSFDCFMIKDLFVQTEMNFVRPYTYAHGSIQQNYGHYNQPLAHPLGANLTESVSIVNYRWENRWLVQAEVVYTISGRDTSDKNFGGNIFKSYTTRPADYGNKFWQGLRTTLFYTDMKIAYELIPESHLVAEAGIINRKVSNDITSNSTHYYYVGIRTNIMNTYRDF